jgi:hypothetical protein
LRMTGAVENATMPDQRRRVPSLYRTDSRSRTQTRRHRRYGQSRHSQECRRLPRYRSGWRAADRSARRGAGSVDERQANLQALSGQSLSSGRLRKKASPVIAQSTNDGLFVCAGSLTCKEEPASERDCDGPIDQGKNDGVDHHGSPLAACSFVGVRAKSHRLTELSGPAAADLIDDALEPVGCWEDRADLASVVE